MNQPILSLESLEIITVIFLVILVMHIIVFESYLISLIIKNIIGQIKSYIDGIKRKQEEAIKRKPIDLLNAENLLSFYQLANMHIVDYGRLYSYKIPANIDHESKKIVDDVIKNLIAPITQDDMRHIVDAYCKYFVLDKCEPVS